MAESCEACWVGGGEHQADCPTLRQDWPANLGQKLRSHIGAGASTSLQAAQLIIDSLVLQLHQSEKCRVEQTKELVALREKASITEIRRAVADYMRSEGCSCCRDIEAHEKHRDTLGKLLGVPKKDDYRSFLPYRSKK